MPPKKIFTYHNKMVIDIFVEVIIRREEKAAVFV